MLQMISVVFAAVSLLTATAKADCAGDNGFKVCMRNCWGQAGCRKTCSRGRSGCLRRCGQSRNFSPVPLRVVLIGISNASTSSPSLHRTPRFPADRRVPDHHQVSAHPVSACTAGAREPTSGRANKTNKSEKCSLMFVKAKRTNTNILLSLIDLPLP